MHTSGRGKTSSSLTARSVPRPSSTPSTSPRWTPHTTSGLVRARSGKGQRCIATARPSATGANPWAWSTAIRRLIGSALGPAAAASLRPSTSGSLGRLAGAGLPGDDVDERRRERTVRVRCGRALVAGRLPDARSARRRAAAVRASARGAAGSGRARRRPGSRDATAPCSDGARRAGRARSSRAARRRCGAGPRSPPAVDRRAPGGRSSRVSWPRARLLCSASPQCPIVPLGLPTLSSPTWPRSTCANAWRTKG